MTLVASTIASAAVITGMIAVMHGGAATSKSYSSYWTVVSGQPNSLGGYRSCRGRQF
jgi:hypothetical protein